MKKPYEETSLKLSTMNSSTVSICKKFKDIKIRGYESNIEVQVKSCFTRDHIPHDRDHIPTKATAREVPYLEEVVQSIPPLQDCEVGLLIGYNCPQALRPVRVITGSPDEAFAVKTDLGWSIVGAHSSEGGYSSCHRTISKELIIPPPCEILKVLDQDFNDA